jgi:tetratricopeptide (TPR) repeat protein
MSARRLGRRNKFQCSPTALGHFKKKLHLLKRNLMRKILTLSGLIVFAFYVKAQPLAQPPNGGNQKAKVIQNIGPVEVMISYSSPHVHTIKGDDRTGHIWGELVHYGFADQGFGVKAAPWRAGANENTTITFSHDVTIEGKVLKAGTYGLFLATAKEGPWTWIFSNNSTSWGSFYYDQKDDALRVDVSPTDAPFTEFLTYGFDDRQINSAVAYLQWEKKRISFKIDVADVNSLYVSIMRNQLRSFSIPGFDYRNFSNAANFCARNKINLEEALSWADHAMSPFVGGQKDFNTMQAKANVLEAMGKNADAELVMQEAINLPDASVQLVHQYGRSLLNAGQREKAMKVFEFNAKKHPEDKFTPNIGLARGYTALGDKKKAIKYWEEAIKNIPEEQKGRIKFYQDEIDKLKSSN